jgi:hypothetical protein
MAERIRSVKAPSENKLGMSDEKLISEFEALLVIDKHALDDYLEQHPDLFYRVGEIVAERIAQRDAAKLAYAEAEAKADAEIRHDAAIAEEKLTADQVKAQIKLDKRVIAAVERHAELVYWCNRWGAMKEAFAARSFAMRELVNLYANGYWSDASNGSAGLVRKSKAGEVARDALKAERERRKGG